VSALTTLINPSAPQSIDPKALLDLARQDLARGDTTAAQDKCLRVLDAHRHHPAALHLFGEILSSQERYDDAVRVFNALTLLEPDVGAHWEHLGTVLRPTGRHSQSLAAFEHALQLGGPTAGLLYNLGALQMDRLDYTAAHLALRDAVALAPRDARIRWTYAKCCYDIGHGQEAVAAVEEWERFEGLSAEITVSIALLLVTSGAAELAQRALQRLMANPPTTGRAAIGFASLLERLHRLDEAQSVMQQLEFAERGMPADAERLAMSAALAERGGRHEEARQCLTTALAGQGESAHRFNLLYPLARALDALGRFDEAFAVAAEAHDSQLAFLKRATGRGCEDQSQLWALTQNSCDPDDVARWGSSGPSRGASPIFVVGFPRSGTTLLEQILDAHPLLQSMDEQPFLLRAVARIGNKGVSYPAGLAGLSERDLNELRAHYWDDVRSRLALDPDRRLVDKNPLNMVLLPIIRRLFPDAPVILAIRHPCDTVLSCFLQHFRSDLALLGRNLGALARSYDRAFGFWFSQCALLQPQVFELKYEQLTADFTAEVTRLCAFLGLTPDPAMLAPGTHARTKGFISTPSYAQVLEPVSGRSVGRWQHYERHFDSAVLAALAPWMERWGYFLHPAGTGAAP
jgi:tetratricopeptide (TPR) repeat protein